MLSSSSRLTEHLLSLAITSYFYLDHWNMWRYEPGVTASAMMNVQIFVLCPFLACTDLSGNNEITCCARPCVCPQTQKHPKAFTNKVFAEVYWCISNDVSVCLSLTPSCLSGLEQRGRAVCVCVCVSLDTSLCVCVCVFVCVCVSLS